MDRGGTSRTACHGAEQQYENQIGEGNEGGDLTESHLHEMRLKFFRVSHKALLYESNQVFPLRSMRKSAALEK